MIIEDRIVMLFYFSIRPISKKTYISSSVQHIPTTNSGLVTSTVISSDSTKTDKGMIVLIRCSAFYRFHELRWMWYGNNSAYLA